MTVVEALPMDIQEALYNYCRNDESLNDAFIRALRTELFRWHDLRKNPDDLPDSNRTVFAVARVGGNRQYPYLAQCWKGSKVEWCCWRNNMQRELVEPIAWCEVPQYTE